MQFGLTNALPVDISCVKKMKYYNDFNIAHVWNLLQAPYLYYLHLTYYNIAEEVFGTNEVFVRNEMGESSYKFTVSNNGGKFL